MTVPGSMSVLDWKARFHTPTMRVLAVYSESQTGCLVAMMRS